jgi:hypothetical protein
VVERTGVIGIGSLEVGHERRDVIEARVGVGPADERVDRLGLSLVVAGVEGLEVGLPLGLGSGQGDLRHLAHLGGPPAQRFDELSKREAARRLRPKSVVVGRLHGPVY